MEDMYIKPGKSRIWVILDEFGKSSAANSKHLCKVWFRFLALNLVRVLIRRYHLNLAIPAPLQVSVNKRSACSWMGSGDPIWICVNILSPSNECVGGHCCTYNPAPVAQVTRSGAGMTHLSFHMGFRPVDHRETSWTKEQFQQQI